ncbi:MAG: DUF839 domain-containing protein [Actinobacteria bacterium]|nr:DUF839 domain-containing protein [Actinomycetota bacterium]
MPFSPLMSSAYGVPYDDTAPWVIPAGYRQYDVSNEADLDIYAGSDWNDMNTVNETGRQAGRYLYRTHEVRGAANASNGAVSVVDLKTGEAKVLVQRIDWDALDGIRWTPWGTILFAEETDGGKLYEITLDKKDPMVATSVTEHLALGVMAHEGIEIDDKGNVYVIDEFRGGAIYKFVPDHRGDLSSGDLYALSVADGGSGLDVGQGTWVLLDRTAVATDARAAVAAANAAGAGIATFQRPEDVEAIGKVLYVAVTESEPQEQAAGAASGDGRVVAIDLRTMKVSNFVKGGVNVERERTNVTPKVTGLKNPDNLAEGPDGRLWIVEDNANSDIWVAEKDRNRDGVADAVNLFASLTDVPAEGTGIYFGKDPHTLFVNVQHSGTNRDRTMAITNREIED